MGPSKSGNAVHDSAVVAAEATRQAAMSGVSTQSAANSATVTFYRSLYASALANGLDGGPFLYALKNLGVGP